MPLKGLKIQVSDAQTATGVSRQPGKEQRASRGLNSPIHLSEGFNPGAQSLLVTIPILIQEKRWGVTNLHYIFLFNILIIILGGGVEDTLTYFAPPQRSYTNKSLYKK